jgi:hypothetical protein
VPIIAAFFGIVVRMFYREHEPAHFHAEHQGQQARSTSTGTWSPARFNQTRRFG